MPRLEKTNLTRSTNLRNAMIAKGYDVAIKEGQLFYEQDGTLHLCVGITEDGYVCTVTQNSIFSELFDSSETLIRAWRIIDLESWMFKNIRLEQSGSEQLANGNWRYRITVNGTQYTGTANTLTNALAECLIAVLNDPNFQNFRLL